MELIKAIKEDELEIFKKILTSNPERIEEKDIRQFSILHHIAKEGKIDFLKFVFENVELHNDIIDSKCCSGDTPLILATMKGYVDIVKELIIHGAQVNIANDHGNTALHYACFWRNKEIAEYLVLNGAIVNIANKYFKVPLDRTSDEIRERLKELSLQDPDEVVHAEARTFLEAAEHSRAIFLAKSNIRWDLSPSAINYGEIISMGCNFQVIQARANSVSVAVKRVINQSLSNNDIQLIKEEITNIRKIVHNNLCQLFAACLITPHVSIMQEYSVNGSLKGILHDPDVMIDKDLAIQLAIDVGNALNFLHNQKEPIYHYNLKSSNVLVYNNNVIKLSEFGFYKSVFNCTTNPNRNLCAMTKDPEWVAPEILKEKTLPKDYSFEYYDIYAYGMLIYEIFTRQYHYPDMNSFVVGYKIVNEDIRPEIPDFIPDNINIILTQCWINKFEERPKIDSIIEGIKMLL